MRLELWGLRFAGSWGYYTLFCRGLVSRVVEIAGNKSHFEGGRGLVGGNFSGRDVKEAAFVDEEFGLLWVIGEFWSEEGDSLLGFFGDAVGDLDVASAAEWIIEIFVGETFVWGEGGTSEAFFQEELAFEAL